LDCLAREAFLDLTERREGVETTVLQVQKAVQERWEREDSKESLVPQDLQEKLEVPETLDLQELLERQEQLE